MTNTQENIINALFQLANKYPWRSDFSISEIANEANISRQAIYQKYFRSRDEIIKFLHETIDNEVMGSLSNYEKNSGIDPWIFFSKHALPIIYKYKDWLKYLYSTALDPNWNLFLRKKYSKWEYNNIQFNTQDLSISKKLLTNFIVGNVLNIIQIWVSQEVPDHPQKFSKIFLSLVNVPIHSFIV